MTNYKSYVYLAKEKGSNLYKIGKGDPFMRVASHNTGNPKGVELVKYWEVESSQNAHRIERAMHAIFRKNVVRDRSEWFRFDSTEIKQLFHFMDIATSTKKLTKYDYTVIAIISFYILMAIIVYFT